jgi:hypothetical protein
MCPYCPRARRTRRSRPPWRIFEPRSRRLTHSRRRIADLEEEVRHFEGLRGEAERRLALAGACRNEDGSWHWRDEDGTEAEFRVVAVLDTPALDDLRAWMQAREHAKEAVDG